MDEEPKLDGEIVEDPSESSLITSNEESDTMDDPKLDNEIGVIPAEEEPSITSTTPPADPIVARPSTVSQTAIAAAPRASSSSGNMTHYLAAVNSLLAGITDKDVGVRFAIEASLIQMINTRPNEGLTAICDFRAANPKLSEAQIAVLVRVTESFARAQPQLPSPDYDTKQRVISLCIAEMTMSNDNSVSVKKPALETLVAISRNDCDMVMAALTNQLQPGQAAHFMILNAMGSMAIANVLGIMPHLKPTLITILPTLTTVKADHVRKAYAAAIGHFAEAINEQSIYYDESNRPSEELTFDAEIAIAYDVFIHQWLPSRDPAVSGEILQALSHMYGLLPTTMISEQATKVVGQILAFYRRSMDRNAITTLLAAVLKSSIKANPKSLDATIDQLSIHLFDLVCVNPDYEKPQTVKGHYEVLRCFDLLLTIYPAKTFDLLLVQLRSNNERDRVKSLLVLTHLCTTCDAIIRLKVTEFIAVLRPMLLSEKTYKVKMVLLKTVAAFAQKGLLEDPLFVRYILRHSCALQKFSTEMGTVDEQDELKQSCRNSLFILAASVPSMDELMKQELLRAYTQIDYTSVCGVIAKCLAKVYARRPDPTSPQKESAPATPGTPGSEPDSITFNNPETIFVRSLILMGNNQETTRIDNILQFLKHFCPHLNKHLRQLWLERIPELSNLTGKPTEFQDRLFAFVQATIRDVDDFKFAESLVAKVANQQALYPQQSASSHGEYIIPDLQQERGMLLKLLGIILGSVSDVQTVDAMIDVIINTGRLERLDKHLPNSDYVIRLADAALALGYVSRVHLERVHAKLGALVQDEEHRKTTNFFAGLNFLKDSGKETEIYKIHVLVTESFHHIVKMAPADRVLVDVDNQMVVYLHKRLEDAKDVTMKRLILRTMLTIAEAIANQPKTESIAYRLHSTPILIDKLFSFDVTGENLTLFPLVLQLTTALVQLKDASAKRVGPAAEDKSSDVHDIFEESCRKFFTTAQQLKTKFETVEEDEHNSFLAKHLNESLPELSLLVKAVFELSSSPATLDDVNGVLEHWMKNRNNEVRICAGHVMSHALEVFLKNVSFGGEAPAKFNQTGSMLAAIVPRCVDSNATVRQTSVQILRYILEIACLYESLTIADDSDEWIKDIVRIHNEIVTDDAKEIYRMTSDLARIIAQRLSNFQYLQFSKSLLYTLNDYEQSSAIGSSVVLKFFVQIKGAELFHAIPEFVKEALHAISTCTQPRAKAGVHKALVALTKHHPKLVCNEMLSQPIPFDTHVKEFWTTLATIDAELCGAIIDNFLTILSSSCLYEANVESPGRKNTATSQPFAIHCTLREILRVKELAPQLRTRFPELFAMFLTSLATYTNLTAPPAGTRKNPPDVVPATRSKFGFTSAKEITKMIPCQVVIEAFHALLLNLDMEQIADVLTVCPNLSANADLGRFIELLTPMAVGLVNQLGIVSTQLSQTVQALSRSVASPYDPQRIAAVGLYSQLVPLRPTGDVASVIMLHLNSALTDPNVLVRGLCVRGLAFVAVLNEHEVDKYSEICLSALLKGVDDFNGECAINVPLESMLGLSRILKALPREKLENFQVSLAIRIRPFFENSSPEIREAAIILFGDLFYTKKPSHLDYHRRSSSIHWEMGDEDQNETINISESLREQLFANFMAMLLHLSETDAQIVRACKVTLRRVCTLLGASKVNAMVQSHLLDHGQLHYEIFVADLLKLIGEELNDAIPEFIETSIPFLKSGWSEIRGHAAVVIGILYSLNQSANLPTESISNKVKALLRDDQASVRIMAARGLGHMFGEKETTAVRQ